MLRTKKGTLLRLILEIQIWRLSVMTQLAENLLELDIIATTQGLKQKLSIVGQIIGRGKAITKEDIYEAMLQVYDDGIITIPKIAKVLGCTPRTIHRNMGEELKKEKQELNNKHEKV